MSVENWIEKYYNWQKDVQEIHKRMPVRPFLELPEKYRFILNDFNQKLNITIYSYFEIITTAENCFDRFPDDEWTNGTVDVPVENFENHVLAMPLSAAEKDQVIEWFQNID